MRYPIPEIVRAWDIVPDAADWQLADRLSDAALWAVALPSPILALSVRGAAYVSFSHSTGKVLVLGPAGWASAQVIEGEVHDVARRVYSGRALFS